MSKIRMKSGGSGGGGSTENIYTIDGTLQADRTVTMDGKYLNFLGTATQYIQNEPASLFYWTVDGNGYIQYGPGNFSMYFEDRNPFSLRGDVILANTAYYDLQFGTNNDQVWLRGQSGTLAITNYDQGGLAINSITDPGNDVESVVLYIQRNAIGGAVTYQSGLKVNGNKAANTSSVEMYGHASGNVKFYIDEGGNAVATGASVGGDFAVTLFDDIALSASDTISLSATTSITLTSPANYAGNGGSAFFELNGNTYRIGGAAGPIWRSGTGSPEGVVTAPVGSYFTRTDGGSGTTLYVKESGAGNTGWIAYGASIYTANGSIPASVSRTVTMSGGTGSITFTGASTNTLFTITNSGGTSVSFQSTASSSTSGSLAGQFNINPSSTNTFVEILRIERQTTGTAAAGIGGAIGFTVEDTTGTRNIAALIGAKWTDATSATRTGAMELWVTNTAVSELEATLANSGLILEGATLQVGGTSGALLRGGTGSPESVVSAPVGSLFMRTDGSATTALYLKTSGTGNTGWAAVTNENLYNANGTLTGNRTVTQSTNTLTFTGSVASTLVQFTNSGAGNVIGISAGAGGGMSISASTGTGILSLTTSGTALQAQTASGIAGLFLTDAASGNTVLEVVRVQRSNSGGSGSNGIGASVTWNLETSSAQNKAGEINFQWTDATNATRTAKAEIRVTNSASDDLEMTIDNTGVIVEGAMIMIGGSSGPEWRAGTGSPEGVVTAPVGSLFSRTDGGAGTSLYVKESGAGNTGWVGK